MAKQHSAADGPFLAIDTALLQSGATELKQLAASLDRQLALVEGWLGRLPGRVEAEVTIPDPELPQQFCLDVKLERGSWLLWFRHRAVTELTGGDWKQLLRAPLDIKIAASAALPLLISKIQESQASLLAKLRSATAVTAQLTERLGIGPKEGA